MQTVSIEGLKELERQLNDVLTKLPEKRKELHQRVGEQVKSALDSNIKSHRVRSWQKPYVGSKGGYTAVRAIGSKEGAKTGPNGPGAITNYLESGHQIRRPSGKAGYSPRIKVGRVPGQYFYRKTQNSAEKIALKAAEAFAEELAKQLGG